MLTRIEIDGFKSFADFSLDIPPFLAIVGPNAAGKSNLFDAIQFLSRLVGDTVDRAFVGARGEPAELFRRKGASGTADTMRFAVEVLLEPTFVDRFGKTVPVRHTRLRYEVRVARWADDGVARSYVDDESVRPITDTDDNWVHQRDVSDEFRSAYLHYGYRQALLETIDRPEDGPHFVVLQEDAGERREIPIEEAAATFLSSGVTAADHPTLYALRQEMQSWQLLHVEPAALRRPSFDGPAGPLSVNGDNLASVLRRIERQTADETGSMLREIAADLARVVRGVVDLRVAEGTSRGQWELFLRTRAEGWISARVTSDGTLRVVALLAALYDPAGAGLICYEEPENGIYPQKLLDLLLVLRSLVTDVRAPGDFPLAQLLLTSHSPVVLSAVPAEQLVVFDWVTRIVPADGERSRVTRARQIRKAGLEPVPLDQVGRYMTEAERRTMIDLDEAAKILG